MRIYHKKNFWAGLGMAALGILNLALSLWRRDFGLSTGILVGALLLLGVSSLLRSLSPKFSREDKIEERDERNILVGRKTYASAFRWTRLVSFGLMALLLVAGAVTGATYPSDIRALRKRLENTFFLVPGYGAQGGAADDVAPGFDKNGLGAIVNSSRGIMCAWQKEGVDGQEYAAAARREAIRMRDEIVGRIGRIVLP